MNAADFLSAADALPFAELQDIVGSGGFVVVAPHPDDESLGCGGLIATARMRGIAVRLVVVSDGVGSHPNSKLYPPDRLKALRERETLHAVSLLGLDATHVRFLGLPDAAVPTSGPDADLAVEAIVAAAAACAATALLVTWRRDPHCDHTAAAVLTDAAAKRIRGVRVLAYPIWGWSLPPKTDVGPGPRGSRFDIAGVLSAKTAAIAAHQSQTSALISDDPAGFRLDASMLQRFARPFEIVLDGQRTERDMTRPRETLGADYFEDLYAGDPDPWRFATSAYEAQKYAATLAALPCSRYQAALEIGCSIGVLTLALADQCETLVAVDAADAALSQARGRCRSQAHVAFACAFVPVDWPDGIYDLVLLSEVIYYLGRDDVDRLASRVRGSTWRGADIVLVHWLGLTDYPLSGDEAADWFIRCSAPFARVIHEYRTERYRIDVLRVGSGPVRE